MNQAFKIDLSQLWNQAIAMLASNRDLVIVLAGVFFFLPYLALTTMLPNLLEGLPKLDPEAAPEVTLAMFQELISRIWVPLLVATVLQMTGSLALLALLRDSARPTLAEALKLGLIALVPYFISQVLFALLVVIGGGLLVGLAGAAHAVLGVLVMVAVLIAAIYLWAKFALTMPVMGVERVYSPISAMARSWRLTKGNSLRLFSIYFLVVIAGTIASMVIEMIFGLVFALFGEQAQSIGNGLVTSLLNAALATVLVAILAAAHRQLAGAAETPAA